MPISYRLGFAVSLWQKPAMDEPMLEDHLDCSGRQRQFRIATYSEGLFLEAVEQRADGTPGLRFVLPVKEGLPPYGELRDLIRARLAQRSIARGNDGWQILDRSVRGQLTDGSSERTPSVLVDDLELTWDELGELLLPFVGWGLRLQIVNCGEE